MKRRKTVSALILLLAAILMLTGLSSCKDPEPKPLTDEEALRGQWAVYYSLEEAKEGNQTDTETEVFAGIIDIQYTKPGYWLLCIVYDAEGPETIDTIYFTEDDSGPDPSDKYIGTYVETNRTQQEDGWFVVSQPPEEGGVTKIRYRFTDEERNTMEAEVIFPENEGSLKCIMRRLNHVIEILPLSEAENPEGEEGATTTT